MLEEPGEEDGEPSLVWLLSGRDGLAAGGRAEGLALRCIDEVGRPSQPIKGRLQVRRRRRRRAALPGSRTRALPAAAPAARIIPRASGRCSS